MKYYLVSDEQFNSFLPTFLHGDLEHQTWLRDAFDRWFEECRKIEVPEWATDFVQFDTGMDELEILRSKTIER